MARKAIRRVGVARAETGAGRIRRDGEGARHSRGFRALPDAWLIGSHAHRGPSRPSGVRRRLLLDRVGYDRPDGASRLGVRWLSVAVPEGCLGEREADTDWSYYA